MDYLNYRMLHALVSFREMPSKAELTKSTIAARTPIFWVDVGFWCLETWSVPLLSSRTTGFNLETNAGHFNRSAQLDTSLLHPNPMQMQSLQAWRSLGSEGATAR